MEVTGIFLGESRVYHKAGRAALTLCASKLTFCAMPSVKKRNDPPHVALIIETSKNYGREILLGIAQYMRLHGAFFRRWRWNHSSGKSR